MSETISLYLAKNGQLYGPFERPQIEELKASGEFYDFEWMWDGQSPDWTPVPRRLSSPPPLPGEAKARGKVSSVEPVPAVELRPEPKPQIVYSKKRFCAIVYDTRSTLGGEVNLAHSGGGKFVSAPQAKSAFAKGATVWVDLLDESTDQAAKIRCIVTGVSRMDSRWVIDLAWNGCSLL